MRTKQVSSVLFVSTFLHSVFTHILKLRITSQIRFIPFCNMRTKQVPKQGGSARPNLNLPAYDWFEDIKRARHAREEATERLCLIAALQDLANQLCVAPIVPEEDDLLETIDPTPKLDLDFPMLAEEFNATFQIEFIQAYAMDYHVTDNED